MEAIVTCALLARLYIGKDALEGEVEWARLVGDFASSIPKDPLPDKGTAIYFSQDSSIASDHQSHGELLIRMVRRGVIEGPPLQAMRASGVFGLDGRIRRWRRLGAGEGGSRDDDK